MDFSSRSHLPSIGTFFFKQGVILSKRRELITESDLKIYDMRILLDFTNIKFWIWELLLREKFSIFLSNDICGSSTIPNMHNWSWSTCHCMLLAIIANLFWFMYVFQKLEKLYQGGMRDQHLSVQISLARNSRKSWLLMTTVKVNCEGMRWIIQFKFPFTLLSIPLLSLWVGWILFICLFFFNKPGTSNLSPLRIKCSFSLGFVLLYL